MPETLISPEKEIFDYWNEAGTIKHRTLDKDKEKVIKEVLKKHSVEEIKQCIKNYAQVVLGSGYWYSYKSHLTAFFRKGVMKAPPYERFLPENFVLQNYVKRGARVI